MAILYALVARQKTVLSEYTSLSGNFITITRQILGKIPANAPSKMTYTYDQHMFHYVFKGGIIYLCMTDSDFGKRVAFAFLEELSRRFEDQFGDLAQTAIALAMQADFENHIVELLEHYNSNDADDISRVKQKITDVQNTMVDSIDKILLRQEKIEILVERTELLSNSSDVFRRGATDLRRKLWWQEKKFWIGITAGGLLFILFIVWYMCGLKFEHC